MEFKKEDNMADGRPSDEDIMARIEAAREELSRGRMDTRNLDLARRIEMARREEIARREELTRREEMMRFEMKHREAISRMVPPEHFEEKLEATDAYFFKKGLMGLSNLGNTCFMNTIIQCINSNRDLVKFMITNEYKEHLKETKIETQLIREWNKLTRILYFKNSSYKPIDFFKCIRNLARIKGYEEFTGYKQNDSTEFLQFFLENIHNSISSEVSMKIKGTPKTELDKWAVDALESWKRFFQNDFSPLVSMYYGQLFSMITTSEDASYRSISFDPFSIINLEIPPKIEKPTIYDCLDAFTHQEELVEYKQDKDDTKKYKKQVRFWKTPDHLVISFKRYNARNQKIVKVIDFPLDGLDMTRYCINYEGKNTIYDLYAVANHVGGLMGGHYFAYCKNIDGVWYKFNDDEIRVFINSSDVFHTTRSVVSEMAYCLFYRRRE